MHESVLTVFSEPVAGEVIIITLCLKTSFLRDRAFANKSNCDENNEMSSVREVWTLLNL